MDISFWLIITSFSKLLFYFCMAGAIGGMGVLWIDRTNHRLISAASKYASIFAMLGVFLTIAYFFIRVGAISEQGLMGMFDQLFIQLLWESNLGNSLIIRILAFVLLLIASHLSVSRKLKNRNNIAINVAGAIYLLALILIGLSFSLIGHVAELAIVARISIALHVILVFWWIGMLWPLLHSCSLMSNQELHRLMHRFGKVASYLVSLLMLAGLLIAFKLFDSVSELFFSTYGQLFLIKILLVSGLLLIAANHKLRLVPILITQENSNIKLAKSIKFEIFIGILVLTATAILTTFVGPTHT